MASESPSIENGVVFQSLKELKLTVRKFALEINFETHTVKSEASRYIIKCKDEHCTWRLRANPIGGGFWKIKELATSLERCKSRSRSFFFGGSDDVNKTKESIHYPG